MSNSALLKSSVAKKYLMAFTGLFLCLFLVGHLAGNLQLLKSGPEAQLQFNEYAYFMTHNPFIKIMSWITYACIIFHAVDGIALSIKNKKARPVGYAYSKPANSSSWYSRKMTILGTVVLIFIVSHMQNFWFKMHYGDVPMQSYLAEAHYTNEQFGFDTIVSQTRVNTTDGNYLLYDSTMSTNGNEISFSRSNVVDQAGTTMEEVQTAEGYKDLHSVVYAFFGKEPVFTYEKNITPNENGMIYAILYAAAMLFLMYHLMHGLASGLQTLGLRHSKFKKGIDVFGKVFAIVVSIAFAIIPLFIHFS